MLLWRAEYRVKSNAQGVVDNPANHASQQGAHELQAGVRVDLGGRGGGGPIHKIGQVCLLQSYLQPMGHPQQKVLRTYICFLRFTDISFGSPTFVITKVSELNMSGDSFFLVRLLIRRVGKYVVAAPYRGVRHGINRLQEHSGLQLGV